MIYCIRAEWSVDSTNSSEMCLCRTGDRQAATSEDETDSMKALLAAYEEKVVPSEERHLWSEFDTPPLRGAELSGKPTVMLLGQYSVGKTSMISYLLGGNYPGADIGPEPTTDFFAHVGYSERPISIPGATLASDSEYQYQTLAMFGSAFLNKLRLASFKAELLQYVSIMDTPGILTGDKQVAARGYDYARVIKVLSDKVDRIILMFDASKLDVSDEYKQVIQTLEGNENKIKIILNKADAVKPRELVEVRGALMWALGKILKWPEVPKVYLGSFWSYWNDKNSELRVAIQQDMDAIVSDILDLPGSYRAQRVNDCAKRARNLRIHTYVMDELMKSSTLFRSRKDAVVTETTPAKLEQVYRRVARQRSVVMNDFPDTTAFHEKASKTDSRKWNRIDPKLESLLNEFIEKDITATVNMAFREKNVPIDYELPEKKPRPEIFTEIGSTGRATLDRSSSLMAKLAIPAELKAIEAMRLMEENENEEEKEAIEVANEE